MASLTPWGSSLGALLFGSRISDFLKCEIEATQVSPCKLNLREECFGRIPSSWPVNLYLTAKLRFPVTGL